MLRGLADVTVRPLLIIFETSWCLGRVPEDWKEANVTPIFKKGKEEDPGNCSLVSLTLIPGKVMEQLILETISRHSKDKKIIRSSQQPLVRLPLVEATLDQLDNFYDEVTGLVDEGRVVGIVYLDFSKAFDNDVFHKIPIEKLLIYGLDVQTVQWIENWPNG